MGTESQYQHCPTSPNSPDGEMTGCKYNWKWILLLAVALFEAILLLVFLGLFLRQQHSESALQLQECQLQMQNQSSRTQDQAVSLRKCMEEMQEAARKEARILNHKLEAVNETLAQTQKNWTSCQNQLNTLEENVTSWDVKENTWKETMKDLQQQLSNKSLQLDEAQHKIQEERKIHQAEIQQLRQQLEKGQQRTSNGGDFGGPSLLLLPILAGYFLSM
ncbi:uncharacterized protein LOC129329614 [Eublepharis macularius]|uniref:Uncharacterized protein LOC129329614 n=1 Tax=Eublepharis macularius TaxID=481883 RepID=A0AA97JD38_EUBMA|nr:uncharacterized protein LOC129329614 [Eublepharis macularius]